MKKITFLLLLLFINYSSLMRAQNKTELKPEHKIIFQSTTGDTTAHKQLMKQFGNILSVSPTTKIEVVCHGAGLEMLVIGKTIVEDKIKLFSEKGVAFNACEFSIKERKVDRAQIIKSAGFVPAGIIEIVTKQEQGWSYIKAGN